MFNKDFYPTRDELIRELLAMSSKFDHGYEKFTLKGMVLEPSAGKGNIIDYIKKRNKHIKVDAIENDLQLVNFLSGAGHTVVWNDFLTYETGEKPTPSGVGWIAINKNNVYKSIDYIHK